jgi:hypothetical protein
MSRLFGPSLVVLALPLAACSGVERIGGVDPGFNRSCSIPLSEIMDPPVPRDGIPALNFPELVGAHEATFLAPDDRVLGFAANGVARAYPLEILWWHEVVNDTVAGEAVLITYCPLTGSGVAFERAPTGDSFRFGVSGLLVYNNLIMFDRTTESLWPQMFHGAACGSLRGTDFVLQPLIETTWQRWQRLQPNTTVLSVDTGYDGDYGVYPYGDYRELNEPPLFPMEVDGRRRPKELVLGVFEGPEQVAYPFLELSSLNGPLAVLEDEVADRPIAVFFEPGSQTAIAYDREVNGQILSFLRTESGEIVDQQTGSSWNVLGEATAGPKAGAVLARVPQSYVAYWFAWAAFNPGTRIWTQ